MIKIVRLMQQKNKKNVSVLCCLTLTSLLFIGSHNSQAEENKTLEPNYQEPNYQEPNYQELNYQDVKSLWRSMRAADYKVPSAQQLANSSQLFKALLAGDVNQFSLQQTEGFKLSQLVINKQLFWLLSETETSLRGAGFYLIRHNGNGIALQATHAFKDLHTGTLAIKLMLEGQFSALAINTIPRSYNRNGAVYNADVAHFEKSHFKTFSQAFARQFPQGEVIQLHGFNSAKRKVTQGVDLILSKGEKFSSRQLQQQANCLSQGLHQKVLVYPTQIKVLGGTTNAIGRALRSTGFKGFKHLEMSLPLRKKLLKQKTLRDRLAECLVITDCSLATWPTVNLIEDDNV